MPIQVAPIDTVTTVTTETPLVCDALALPRLLIDAPDINAPAAEIVTRPYKRGVNGQPDVYASTTETYRTSDLYAAIPRLPKIAAAMQAVFEAVAEWHAYNDARRADLAAALADHATAEQTAAGMIADAEQAFTAADAAYAQAYQVRTANDDPDWLAAIEHRRNTAAARDAVRVAAAAYIRPLAERVAIAQAALDDPANPPLEDAA